MAAEQVMKRVAAQGGPAVSGDPMALANAAIAAGVDPATAKQMVKFMEYFTQGRSSSHFSSVSSRWSSL